MSNGKKITLNIFYHKHDNKIINKAFVTIPQNIEILSDINIKKEFAKITITAG